MFRLAKEPSSGQLQSHNQVRVYNDVCAHYGIFNMESHNVHNVFYLFLTSQFCISGDEHSYYQGLI
jgi:hypothetical protein